MTIIAGIYADASYARSRPGSGLVDRVIHAAKRITRRQRTQRALGRLSDHMLKDIGVRRSEIDSIAASLASGNWDSTRIPRGHASFWI